MKRKVLLAWSQVSVTYNRGKPIHEQNNIYKLFLTNIFGEKSLKTFSDNPIDYTLHSSMISSKQGF